MDGASGKMGGCLRAKLHVFKTRISAYAPHVPPALGAKTVGPIRRHANVLMRLCIMPRHSHIGTCDFMCKRYADMHVARRMPL